MVGARRVRAALAVGDLDGARDALAWMRPGVERSLAQASVHVADRRNADALDCLVGMSGWPVHSRVIGLLTAAAASPDATARAHVEQALGLAAPGGLVGPFLGRGPRVDSLVGAAPSALRAGLHPVIAGAGDRDRRTELVEPLTPRELDLLVLLPTHLSNAAMGERLYISVNTVKTNLKAIYRKMGTGSRAETVELAKQMGLLPVTAPA
jgi:LuxR family maltose regulon positive regulatory protein